MAAFALSFCKTPLGETGCLGNPYFLFTGCPSIQFFDSPPFFNTVSQATCGYLLLTEQHMCDLCDVMPCHWSPDTSYSPFTASATDLLEHFLTLRRFLPYTPTCCFQGLPEASSSPSKVAGFHVDNWNIAPAQLFFESQQSTKEVSW